MLRLIAGLADEIEFTGHTTATDNAPLAGRIGYMAQSDLLLPWATLTANVAIGARLRGERADTNHADAMLERVGLADHRTKKPGALSGGQRQRVALARTLMEDRPVILLDEPFSALDARTRADMQELAAELLKGRTVLLVTHDPAEASRLGHAITVMDETGLTQAKTPTATPVRAMDDPERQACEIALYRQLRGQ